MGGEGAGHPFIDGLRALYADERFRIALLVFDGATILLFLLLTFVPPSPWVATVDAAVGMLIAVELAGRALAAPDRLAFLRRPGTLLDIAIVFTLLVPTLTGSFVFLRVLRALRLFRALDLVRRLARRQPWIAMRADTIGAAVNLVIFVFVTSAVVYELQVTRNPEIETFTDALYFTVTTLTTTGFGDITLIGESGRLISVLIMIVGISLFVRLAQAIVRPQKVHVECQVCGLSRHDPDAVHCKHCGTIVHIDTEGA
ncbi:MAG TPA: ion channel [Alphaproteobacteria bacterium]|nr:ion channel [Alphaproteobacteria bacterium]